MVHGQNGQWGIIKKGNHTDYWRRWGLTQWDDDHNHNHDQDDDKINAENDKDEDYDEMNEEDIGAWHSRYKNVKAMKAYIMTKK